MKNLENAFRIRLMLKFFLLLLFFFCATVHADWGKDDLCDPAVANQNMVRLFDIRSTGTTGLPLTRMSQGGGSGIQVYSAPVVLEAWEPVQVVLVLFQAAVALQVHHKDPSSRE